MRRFVMAGALLVAIVPAVAALAAPTTSGSAFVVGGGRYDLAECPINFSLSGHTTAGGAAGTQTVTYGNAPGAIPGCPGQGHVKATVTCLAVSGNQAEVRGVVTEATGALAAPFFSPGDVLVTDVQDNGNPSSGTPDRIQQSMGDPGSQLDCQAPTSEVFTVDRGNVTVHD